jgi:hypothetical protein
LRSERQTDNDGVVPVMLHKFSIGMVAAKSALLSLPFAQYSGKKAVMPTDVFNPDEPWDMDRVVDYSTKYLQKFYVCPFIRGKAKVGGWFELGETLKIGGATKALRNYRSVGLGDSYSTWIWPRPAGYQFEGFAPGRHQYGPEHGKNKYANVQWHAGGDPTAPGGVWVDQPAGYDKVKDHPVKFAKIPRIAERTAVYCIQGEVDESSHGLIINFGSHAKAGKGGTNVVFGDAHLEWVQGSQITAGN